MEDKNMANNTNQEVTGWTGWVAFASFMMLLLGFMHLLAGFVGLFKDDVYISTHNAVWLFDYSQWGWIHIIGGLLVLGAAGSLMQGRMFGRTVAVIIALISAVANMAFIPVYPFWSILMVTVCVLVIWAVTVHGDELRD
jgi:hypothetical protein